MRLVCCLCWALLGGPVVAQNSPLEQVQQQIQAIADAAEPSVVALVISHNPAHGTVKAERPWELGDYVPAMRQERFGPLRRAAVPQLNPLDLADHRNISNYTLASAIVLDAEQGLLLTTAHLLDGVRKVFVRFPNGGGGSFADLHAADFRSDLAVLKLRTKSPKLRTIRFTTETTPATRGQWVVSLAYPFGTGFIDGKPSVSWGMVSNVGRKGTLPVGSEDMHPGYLTQYSSLIQTDARLNIGVSGGALLNLRGELVGMTSATAGLAGSETAGGFAVPMDRIYRGIIDVLKQGREVEYGFLGVSPGGMSQEPDRPGLYVNTVTPSSGAAAVGMMGGDVIASVDGQAIRDESDLYLLVGGALAGNKVTLAIRRGGNTLTVQPVLGKFQHPYPIIASVRPEAIYGMWVDYSSITVQQMFGPGARFQPRLEGVIVREFEKDSPAERAFSQLPPPQGRWLILRVDNKPVATPKDFYNVVGKNATFRLTVTASFDPAGRTYTVKLP